MAWMLHRRRPRRPAPPGRPVRLRDHADDVVSLAEQRAQRGQREVGRAPEQDAHAYGLIFCHLLISSLRFSGLTRSTKRMPSRMIDLVLEDPRASRPSASMTTRSPSRLIPSTVTRKDAPRSRAGRNAQAALLARSVSSLTLDDLRVEQRERQDVRLARIDHDDARDAHLRRGQADAFLRVHRVEHVLDERADLVRQLLDGAAFSRSTGSPM
jgi:hypothetical protein